MSERDWVLGRQPIVDGRGRTVAFELLFRDSADATSARFECGDTAAIQVLVNAVAGMGLASVVGPYDAFFNVTETVLHGDLITLLPKERVVIELLESSSAGPGTLERCRELREQGFRIALDDWAPKDQREALLPHAAFVKIDLPAFEPGALRGTVRQLRGQGQAGLQVLAEKVETREEFAACRKLGFELFQGYHFARPRTLAARRVDPERSALLGVLDRLNQDISSAEIAEALKPHPKLGLTVLRLANASGFAPAQKLTRIEDAIGYVGRDHLTRWVAVLLFATDTASADDPLLLSAAQRARMLELLAAQVPETASAPDAAFLVGLLSLVDRLFDRPIESILTEMNLDDAVARAVLEREGPLGELLDLVEAFQETRFDSALPRLRALRLSPSTLRGADQAALAWMSDVSAQLRAA